MSRSAYGPAALPLPPVARPDRAARAPRAGLFVRLRTGDRYLQFVTVCAAILSLGSFAYFYAQGVTVAYRDAGSRLMIARRTAELGFGQLGGVWLPLHEVTMLPLVWNDFFYRTGLAGTVVSMFSYVLTGILLYKTVLLLTGERGAGALGASAFLLNPNILYMQTTPMSELLLFLLMAATAYAFIAWAQDPSQVRYLCAGAFAISLASLTRYESWGLLPVMAVLVGYVCVRNRFDKDKIEAYLITFGLLSGYGIVLWLLWNLTIFGNAFYFQNSEYATPANWVSSQDRAVGDGLISLKTYGYATLNTIGLPLLCLAALGLVAFLAATRLSAKGMGALTLLFPFPFFVVMLYLGQRPLYVTEIMGDLYNVRFGLTMILPVAIFCGYLSKGRGWRKAIVGVGIGVGLVWTLGTYGIVTLREPIDDRAIDPIEEETARWLAANYDDEPMLMENFGNEPVAFESALPLRHVIYEGSLRQWEQTLLDPASHVAWIYMRDNGAGGGRDKVWSALHDDMQSSRDFVLVYKNNHIEIYKKQLAATR
ncbi:MAG TPA: hypothetical protein VIL85_07810 [Thermomicrobiales bacterium]|jgi:hypothetical protein